MKHLSNILALLFLVLLSSNCSQNADNLALKLMSFNIRYDNPKDGPNAWDHRKEMVVDVIRSREIDIVGMQEVLKHQEEYMRNNLPEYEVYGVGREDGQEKGEFGSIFFLRERFELLDKGTFWLSETPDSIGSIGWDAVLARIASWVKLYDRETASDIYFFNTHYSHIGYLARKNSSILLMNKIPEIAGDHPVILSGDFNCSSKSEPYMILTGNNDKEPFLFDTQYISETDHIGGLKSINGFRRDGKVAIIDYLFCNSSFRTLEHGIIAIQQDSVFISDHYPVVATLLLLESRQ